jgi:antitoxin (DNA-binding transcriptional repressor) of toxin-antitoxin stability system
MIKLNIHEAKTHLSRYLKRILRGETILLCKRNIPIAEIRPIRAARTKARPIGLAREEYGEFRFPESFFEPLPKEILDGFEGKPA